MVHGLSPITTLRMYNIYVVPHLIYSFEALILTKSQLNKLGLFQRSILRQLQGLPDRAQNSTTYLLLGALPLEVSIDIRTLTLLGKIAS